MDESGIIASSVLSLVNGLTNNVTYVHYHCHHHHHQQTKLALASLTRVSRPLQISSLV